MDISFTKSIFKEKTSKTIMSAKKPYFQILTKKATKYNAGYNQ